MATLQQSRGSTRKPLEATTPSAASYMNPEQLEHYLHSLRHNRPARPSGARPLGEQSGGASVVKRRFQPPEPVNDRARGMHEDVPKPLSGTARPSMAREPTSRNLGSQASKPSQSAAGSRGAPYDIPYYERGQRWMERQEAQSLTRALQDMDVKGDAQVFAAAQQEAAQLVWKHQNPNAAYHNPDFDYRQHLRKGSHARSQSIGPFKELYVQRRPSTDELVQTTDGSRKVSSGSHGTQSTSSTGSGRGSRYSFSGSLRERAMNSLPVNIIKSRSGSGRRLSGRGFRKTSDEKYGAGALFSNPADKIYEEPIDSPAELPADTIEPIRPLRVKSRNTSYGKPGMSPGGAPSSKPGGPRDSKAQGANPQAPYDGKADAGLRLKNGMEIRNDEIRAATSMKLKDRSAKLPQPSTVSDVLGRPIVSFDPEYRSPKKQSNPPRVDRASNREDLAGVHNQAPIVPSIQVDNVPSIAITPEVGSTPTVPSINVDSPSVSQDVRTQPVSRARPRPQPAIPTRGTHWSLAGANGRPQAQCAACALGIQGKIVSAANQRFHPQCFSCYHCGELLECVAFYPEPEQARAERLMRHEARMNGERFRHDHGAGFEDDGDTGLRFYCHLDFHEKFSPRCKSCKTPIEGKVVVACGAEWHEGHFFCAQCGDPFDQNTPFIEKEGHAWCVPCHTRRFSGKCAGCKKPIVDMVVNALEKEWHEECFCCAECGSQFDDGRFFTNYEGENPICVRCEERRLKA